MSRRLRKTRTASHDRWLVSYADFITLLFAFFVVLYASSEMDRKRVVEVSQAIKGGFEQLGAFSEPAPALPAEAATLPQVQLISARSPIPDPNAGDTGEGMADINQLRRDLESALGEQIKKHEIEVHSSPEGLVVSLREVGFFDSGDASLLPEGTSTLTRIAQVLNQKRFQIRVEGHTDNVPIHTGRFRSNWELSTARATEVVQLLIEQHDFDPSLISAAGYSQYRPVASNDTSDGRQQNRRVDVVVVARSPQKGEAKPSAAVQ